MRKDFFAYSKHAVEALTQELLIFTEPRSIPVIVCLGTDKVLADALGAIVGSLLNKQGLSTFVYGNLERPITLANINYCLKFVRAMHPISPIWVIDSATSYDNRFGVITISDEFNPFVNTKFVDACKVEANLFITATVSQAEKRVLFGARLRVIVQIAEVITQALCRVFESQDVRVAYKQPCYPLSF